MTLRRAATILRPDTITRGAEIDQSFCGAEQLRANRAETLIHESRHQGGKPHDANFPAGSVFGAGKSEADSSWGYEGAWMYGALYLWWYYAEGARTTSALRECARQRGNLVIDNAFATHPGYSLRIANLARTGFKDGPNLSRAWCMLGIALKFVHF